MNNGVSNNKVYVVGHKNPDTDSICSAIAYANLKSKITGEDYSPRRAGQLNEETQYVLDHFQVEAPKLLSDLRVQVKDVELRNIEGIKGKCFHQECVEIYERAEYQDASCDKGQQTGRSDHHWRYRDFLHGCV